MVVDPVPQRVVDVRGDPRVRLGPVDADSGEAGLERLGRGAGDAVELEKTDAFEDGDLGGMYPVRLKESQGC